MKKFVFILALHVFINPLFAQTDADKVVKSMIDLNDIQVKLTASFKKKIPDNQITSEPGFYSALDEGKPCRTRAIEKAIVHIEKNRLKEGLKTSAKTTVSLFSKAFGGLGFKYAADAVNILSKLDEVQEAGGDADDFAKAFADFAFSKASGSLVNKVKGEFPDMFDSETLTGAALDKMISEASSQTNSFFQKLLKPATTELFLKQQKDDNCSTLYYVEIAGNTNNEVPGHVGPILVLKVAMWCKECPPNNPLALRHCIVKFNIPLELTSKPLSQGFFAKLGRVFSGEQHQYIFKPNIAKTTIHMQSNCCNSDYGVYQETSYISPDEETLYAITSTGFSMDKSGDFSGYTFDPGLGLLYNVNAKNSVGGKLRYSITSFKGPNNRSTQNGPGADIFFQHVYPNMFTANNVTPYVRATVPFQGINFSSTDSLGNLLPTGQNRSIGINAGVGLNVKLPRVQVNVGFDVLGLSSSKYKNTTLSNPQFGPRTNVLVGGLNTSGLGFEVVWPLR